MIIHNIYGDTIECNVQPCPVCGSTDIDYYKEGYARERHGEIYFTESPEYFIECNRCGFEVYCGLDYEQAAEKWNTAVPSNLDKRAWERIQKQEQKQNEL